MTGLCTHKDNGRVLTVRLPFQIKKRGGRKLVIAPEENNGSEPRPRVDSTMVKAIARGFRWRGMLENGDYTTIREIALAEQINESYVGRVLRLTLLAPEIVEAILDGRQPTEMTLARLMGPFSTRWQDQFTSEFGRN